MAAGLAIKKTNYALFEKVFKEIIEQALNGQPVCAEIQSDGELTQEDFCVELADLLRTAGPWGQAFPEPVFDGRFRVLQQWLVGGGKHLKLSLAFHQL